MRSIITAFSIIYLLSAILAAHGTDADISNTTATLFLSTAPLKAQVRLDGEDVDRETPLILREIKPGKHILQIGKPGYRNEYHEFEALSGKIQSLHFDLVGTTIRLAFPSTGLAEINGAEETIADRHLKILDGTYRIFREDDLLRIAPQYPHQGWLTGLTLALPVALLFSGYLTVNDILYPWRPSFALSPFTLSSYGINLAIIGLDLAFAIHKNK